MNASSLRAAAIACGKMGTDGLFEELQ